MLHTAKIIIACSDKKNTSELLQSLLLDKKLEVIVCLNSGERVMSLVVRSKPDFLVLDSSLTGVNCIEILKQVVMLDKNRPTVIMYCDHQNDVYWQLANKYNIDLIMQKPIIAQALIAKIHHIMRYGITNITIPLVCSNSVIMFEKEITTTLNELGMQDKLKGFYYLRIALVLVISDIENLFSMSKILYSRVGEYFGVSERSVYKSINTAIRNMWDSDKDSSQRGPLCNFTSVPTNAEFISIISDDIKLKLDQLL